MDEVEVSPGTQEIAVIHIWESAWLPATLGEEASEAQGLAVLCQGRRMSEGTDSPGIRNIDVSHVFDDTKFKTA